jgi:hypothetical protein
MKNEQLAFPTKRSSELKAGIPKSKLCPHLHKLLRTIHASKVTSWAKIAIYFITM